MNNIYTNVITIIGAILLFCVCYGKRFRKSSNIVQFHPKKKAKKTNKYNIKVIKNSEIRPEELITDQDIKREGYYNAVWNEIEK